MTTLADWIEYGLAGEHYRNKALVRRWIREARERRPIIDRVNYPNLPRRGRQLEMPRSNRIIGPTNIEF